MKKIIICLVVCLLIIFGCVSKNISKEAVFSSPQLSTMPPVEDNESKDRTVTDLLTDPKYFIYNVDWLDSTTLLAQLTLANGDIEAKNAGRVVAWNIKTNEQKLLYEGKETPGTMPAGMVFGENGFYTYDGKASLKFDNNMVLQEIIKTSTPGKRIHPSKNDEFVRRVDNGLGYFSLKEQTNIIRLKEPHNHKTKDGHEYIVFYEVPKWSPNGSWIGFYEIAQDFIIPPKLGIISRDGKIQRTFKFDTATDFEWSSDSKYLIGINDGNIFRAPLEIKIFDIETGEVLSQLFDKPIEGQKVYYFYILDSYDTKLLLKTHIEYNKKEVTPVLLYDWKTGEKEFLTQLDYWTVAASFSQDGRIIAVSGNNKEKPIEFYEIKK